jgi:acyl-CoA synthetase (AMP-forming)/AMP-acid ligase II
VSEVVALVETPLSFPVAESSITDLVRARAARAPEALAFTFADDDLVATARYRYADVDRRARAVAVALREHVRPGDRALLVFPPGLELMEAFFGCLYAGVVAVPVYPPDPRRLDRSMAKLRALSRDAAPRAVLSTGFVAGMTGSLGALAPEITALPWIAVDAVPDERADAYRPIAQSREDVAFLQYTSGSTSDPKGVVVTHDDVLDNEELQRRFMGHEPGLVLVGWLPLYHDMGLIGNLLQPLYVGGVSHLLSPTTFLRRPLRWLEAITRHRPGTSGGPNFAYELCLRKIAPEERDGLDLSSLTVMVNAAEPLRADTIDRFCEYFAPCGFRREAFYPCYGLAEATLIAAGSSKGRGPIRRDVDADALARGRVVLAEPGSVGARPLVGSGRTLPEQTLRIVEPETRVACPPDRVGEIWLAGPSVTRGYTAIRRARATRSGSRRAARAGRRRSCARATSGSCSMASCSSPGAARTCSSSAARTTTRRTSSSRSSARTRRCDRAASSRSA